MKTKQAEMRLDKPAVKVIDCEGADLIATLARLEAEGGRVWRVDVVKVSAYRLHVSRASQAILGAGNAPR